MQRMWEQDGCRIEVNSEMHAMELDNTRRFLNASRMELKVFQQLIRWLNQLSRHARALNKP